MLKRKRVNDAKRESEKETKNEVKAVNPLESKRAITEADLKPETLSELEKAITEINLLPLESELRQKKRAMLFDLLKNHDVIVTEKALYRAAEMGDKGVYLELMARTRLLNPHYLQGWTPLHIAAANGHANLINAMLEKKRRIDINVLESNEMTPVYLAAQEGQVEAIDVLIMQGADLTIASNGVTPLMIAQQRAREDMAPEKWLAVVKKIEETLNQKKMEMPRISDNPQRFLQSKHLSDKKEAKDKSPSSSSLVVLDPPIEPKKTMKKKR